MKHLLMAVAVLVGPGLWALAVHWILSRIWPTGGRSSPGESPNDSASGAAEWLDYQI